jgi:DNA-directed RNA polymerase subunit RPC12/RpoP
MPILNCYACGAEYEGDLLEDEPTECSYCGKCCLTVMRSIGSKMTDQAKLLRWIDAVDDAAAGEREHGTEGLDEDAFVDGTTERGALLEELAMWLRTHVRHPSQD